MSEVTKTANTELVKRIRYAQECIDNPSCDVDDLCDAYDKLQARVEELERELQRELKGNKELRDGYDTLFHTNEYIRVLNATYRELQAACEKLVEHGLTFGNVERNKRIDDIIIEISDALDKLKGTE